MLNRDDEAKTELEKLRSKRFKAEDLQPVTETGEELVNFIRDERRRELCFEGHRWFDLIRYKDNYALNFLHSIGKTSATTKHLLFPIPQQEIEANSKLTQNPGY